MTSRPAGVRLAVMALLLLGWPPASARGAGLEVFAHGARALGRAGAFVAGADDPSGILYNPATIGGLLGVQVMADAALIFYDAEYTRVDSGGNLLPKVTNAGPLMPLPTVGLSLPVYRDRLFVGAALTAPYSPFVSFPRPSYSPCSPDRPGNCIDTAHTDSPQRYSGISNEGTTIVELNLTLAARVLENLYAGLSVQNLFVSYVAMSSITTYNGALSSGPEDPDYDVLTQMKLNAFFNPSAKLGLLWLPHRAVRLGVAYQLPFWVGGGATVNTQLPVSALYQSASVVGNQARVSFNLPMSLRVGSEWVAARGLRLELDLEWMDWSTTEAIVVEPENIYIFDLPSIDRFKVPTMKIPLLFQDSFAVRLGGEYRSARLPLLLRAGYVFERGAVQHQYASVLSMDNDKHVITAGASYTLWGFRLDVGVARSFSATRVVHYLESKIQQVNPINQTGAAAVGGGSYHADFTLFALGVHRTF